MTVAATASIAGGNAIPPPATLEHGPPPDALNGTVRDQIDALRAAADLLMLNPVADPWIAVTRGSIQLAPGGAAGGQATAVDSLAARLGTTAEITRHHGRIWHSARGHLGRHPITVFAALDEEEPSR